MCHVTRQTFGARLYRRLLRLYPREFLEEYGAEMARLYRDRARDEGALRLWLALPLDVVRYCAQGATQRADAATFATRSVCFRVRRS